MTTSPPQHAPNSFVFLTNQAAKKRSSILFRPTFSPEHGVLLVLFGSFVTGAALAQQWTYTTTVALVCALFALQIEHPFVVQIKLRKIHITGTS